MKENEGCLKSIIKFGIISAVYLLYRKTNITPTYSDILLIGILLAI